VAPSDRLAELQQRSFESARGAVVAAYPADRRMSGATLAKVLTSRKYVVVATVRGNGRPHAALSSFVWSRDRVWLPTESGAARVNNVRAVSYASLVFSEGEDESHAAILMEGPAELIPLDGAPEEPMGLWHEKFSHLPEWADLWITVEPRRLWSYAAEGWSPPIDA
jgi:general stress protein 26